jgi:hypothetical protein
MGDQVFYQRRAREALRMARAYASNQRLRVIYQERAADYRECLCYHMRRRQGWTLAQIVAGRR